MGITYSYCLKISKSVNLADFRVMIYGQVFNIRSENHDH